MVRLLCGERCVGRVKLPRVGVGNALSCFVDGNNANNANTVEQLVDPLVDPFPPFFLCGVFLQLSLSLSTKDGVQY